MTIKERKKDTADIKYWVHLIILLYSRLYGWSLTAVHSLCGTSLVVIKSCVVSLHSNPGRVSLVTKAEQLGLWEISQTLNSAKCVKEKERHRSWERSWEQCWLPGALMEEQQVCLTTDNAANIVKAVAINKWTRVQCIVWGTGCRYCSNWWLVCYYLRIQHLSKKHSHTIIMSLQYLIYLSNNM